MVFDAVIPKSVPMKKFILALLGSAALITGGVISNANSGTDAAAQVSSLLSSGSSKRVVPDNQVQVQLSYSPVVKQTAPAVVNVYSSRTVRSRGRSDFFDFMFGTRQAPQERMQNSLGSGVIVRDNGVIVTNAHVVKGGDELKVVLSDRREFIAELIAQDEETDIAVLKIDTKSERLPYLRVSTDGDVEIGDIVLAIGNPFGVGQTVTGGIISALGRTNVTDVSSFIQTDAAVNPGNSGGALVNLSGELIGVNTAIFSRSGGSNGIGFAIPSVLVGRAVDSALSEGRIVRPWLGARTQGLDSNMAAALGLDRARGAVINDIFPNGPAATGGLKERDVVLSVDGKEVNDDSGLKFQFATLKKDQRTNVRIWRDGRERTISIRADIPREIPKRDERQIDDYNPLDGASIVNLSPVLAEELGVDPYLSGVMVSKTIRRSAAAANGLRPGDIFVELNGTKITSTRQLESELKSVSESESFDLTIDRSGRIYDVPARYWPQEN